MVGQTIGDKKTLKEISNLTRFGRLVINASHLVEESRELYQRGEITTNDMKIQISTRHQTLPIKQDPTMYKREIEIQMKAKANEHVQ